VLDYGVVQDDYGQGVSSRSTWFNHAGFSGPLATTNCGSWMEACQTGRCFSTRSLRLACAAAAYQLRGPCQSMLVCNIVKALEAEQLSEALNHDVCIPHFPNELPSSILSEELVWWLKEERGRR
jgi:hypothetical protein